MAFGELHGQDRLLLSELLDGHCQPSLGCIYLSVARCVFGLMHLLWRGKFGNHGVRGIAWAGPFAFVGVARRALPALIG